VTEALRDVFLAQLAPRLREAFTDRPSLDEELRGVLERAGLEQPELEVDGPGFVAHLAGRVADEAALPTLHAGDALLAFGCLLGDPTALAIFERDVVPRAQQALRGSLPAGLTTDEVMQRLRVRLLLREGERAPALTSYSGRGALVHWCRATTVRLVQEFARAQQREVPSEDGLLEAAALTRDLDVSLLKQRFAPAFASAFKAALAQLSPRDRRLLQLHYLEGMRAEELGRVFSTHRTTVWRWLTQCREQLLRQTRAELQKTVADAELSSLMNVVHSQLDLSISRVLRAGPGEPGSEAAPSSVGPGARARS
jgi:RNA polymerase sigma-70 factor (ECF subfamily)